MPKATLSFKLPEEHTEFTAATQAGEMRAALWAIDEYLRQQVKYCDHPPAVAEVYRAVRAMLHEELTARNVVLE